MSAHHQKGQPASGPRTPSGNVVNVVNTNDDDLNDMSVTAMGGVNPLEESQEILESAQFVGTQIRSSEENLMCSMGPLQQRIKRIMAKHGLEEPGDDVAAGISDGTQDWVEYILQQLSLITEYRALAEMEKDKLKDKGYEVTNDVKGKLKFLEDIDRAIERKKNEAKEREREELLRAAKSRPKTGNLKKAKLMAKAKAMQRLDGDAASGSAQTNSGGPNVGVGLSQVPFSPQVKIAALDDIHMVFRKDSELRKSKVLRRSHSM